MKITRRQRQVLTFIRNWQETKKYSPSLHDIGTHLLQSPYTFAAQKHVAALCRAGLLKKDPQGRIKFPKWTPFKAPTVSMGRCYLFAHALPKA